MPQYILETRVGLIKRLDSYVGDENTDRHTREKKKKPGKIILAHNLITNWKNRYNFDIVQVIS